MDHSQNLYAILGIAPEASDEDIRHAYHGLARRQHQTCIRDRSRAQRSRHRGRHQPLARHDMPPEVKWSGCKTGTNWSELLGTTTFSRRGEMHLVERRPGGRLLARLADRAVLARSAAHHHHARQFAFQRAEQRVGLRIVGVGEEAEQVVDAERRAYRGGDLTGGLARAAAQRFAEAGAGAWWSDPVETYLPSGFACPKCGSTTFEKEKNIVDIWFESGVTHLAVLGHDGLPWPADVVLEGGDQYRGWFRSSLVTGIAIKGAPPYRHVIKNGWVNDAQGRAMSKSLGNYVAAADAMERFGADVLRLWAASVEFVDDVRFGEALVEQVGRGHHALSTNGGPQRGLPLASRADARSGNEDGARRVRVAALRVCRLS